MRRLVIRQAILALSLLAAFGCSPQVTQTVENEGPDGGDGLIAEFVAHGREIERALRGVKKIHRFPDDQLERVRNGLPDVILKSKVSSQERTFLDSGTEVTAMNYRSKRLIVVSRSRWPELKSRAAKHRLVLHEYLGLMGEREAAYEITDALLAGISDLLEVQFDFSHVQAGPHLISDCEEFQLRLSKNTADKSYALAADIDCSGESAFRSVPHFRGVLDGRNPDTGQIHKIRGISIRPWLSERVGEVYGIFQVSSGTIRNMVFEGVSVSTLGSAGGLVADNRGLIENVKIESHVRGVEAGGIVARNFGEITDSDWTGSIDSTSSTRREATGGIAAQNLAPGRIIRVSARGEVHGTRNVGGIAGINYSLIKDSAAREVFVEGEDNVGGIAGKNQLGSGDLWFGTGVLEGCAVSGRVESRLLAFPLDLPREVGNVGGIVGYNKSLVRGSASSASVCGMKRDSNIGLVAGALADGASVEATSSTGTVSFPCREN